MSASYVIIIAIVTYVLGTLVKLKWDNLPHKYIPIQNVLIAFISALICFFSKIEGNLLQSFILCFTATMGAGGTHDLIKVLTGNDEAQESEKD